VFLGRGRPALAAPCKGLRRKGGGTGPEPQ